MILHQPPRTYKTPPGNPQGRVKVEDRGRNLPQRAQRPQRFAAGSLRARRALRYNQPANWTVTPPGAPGRYSSGRPGSAQQGPMLCCPRRNDSAAARLRTPGVRGDVAPMAGATRPAQDRRRSPLLERGPVAFVKGGWRCVSASRVGASTRPALMNWYTCARSRRRVAAAPGLPGDLRGRRPQLSRCPDTARHHEGGSWWPAFHSAKAVPRAVDAVRGMIDSLVVLARDWQSCPARVKSGAAWTIREDEGVQVSA